MDLRRLCQGSGFPWPGGCNSACVPCEQVESLYPRPGWVELEPELLWSQFVAVVKEAVQGNGL